eukprot:TRINITY_DN354_c0_g1_i9.p2 TRINITY_DN354_c0_g1~~TRINITY_DN354_c0_g1_i9.p2  ORF type:complete len:227 (+),score=-19.31 TRINITY_DN354_c0_g1_i9:121-801(+)
MLIQEKLYSIKNKICPKNLILISNKIKPLQQSQSLHLSRIICCRILQGYGASIRGCLSGDIMNVHRYTRSHCYPEQFFVYIAIVVVARVVWATCQGARVRIAGDVLWTLGTLSRCTSIWIYTGTTCFTPIAVSCTSWTTNRIILMGTDTVRYSGCNRLQASNRCNKRKSQQKFHHCVYLDCKIKAIMKLVRLDWMTRLKEQQWLQIATFQNNELLGFILTVNILFV